MYADDSDMKIAPEKPGRFLDSSDGAATAFMRETHNGNMEKARGIGGALARALTAEDSSPALFGVGAFDDENTIRQRRMMFAYIADKVIEDLAPNSMVAQSAISNFENTVQQCSPEIYEIINDTAAFSLYALCARGDPDDTGALGRVFAKLCKKEDDALFVKYGCELSGYFNEYCTKVVLGAGLVR